MSFSLAMVGTTAQPVVDFRFSSTTMSSGSDMATVSVSPALETGTSLFRLQNSAGTLRSASSSISYPVRGNIEIPSSETIAPMRSSSPAMPSLITACLRLPPWRFWCSKAWSIWSSVRMPSFSRAFPSFFAEMTMLLPE